jgi:hypothetical protein
MLWFSQVLLTCRTRVGRIDNIRNHEVEVQPLLPNCTVQLFKSWTRDIKIEEVKGEGRLEDRLERHETLVAMKGNPGLIISAGIHFSEHPTLSLRDLKSALPGLLEYMISGVTIEELFKKHEVSLSGQTFWSFQRSEVAFFEFFVKLSAEFSNRTGITKRVLGETDQKFFISMINRKYENDSEEVMRLSSFPMFWNWFRAFCKVINQTSAMWCCKDPQIIYLCSLDNAVEILRPCRTGSFLLRFSESNPGMLSISRKFSKTEVEHLLICKKKCGGWIHYGEAVVEEYDTVPDLLNHWTGKYIGGYKKDEVFQKLNLPSLPSSPAEDTEEKDE